MPTQRFGATWSDGSANALSAVTELEGVWAPIGDFTLAAGTVTDHQEQIGFDVNTIKGLLIVVTGNPNTTVTLETNATDHAGGQIKIFPAAAEDGATVVGGLLFWTEQSPEACPLTTDVTTTYWTKTGADTPRVQVRVLYGN